MADPAHRTLDLANLAATRRLGQALAAALAPGDFVALAGPLGVGKTELARAVLGGLGVADEVPSPTFTLVQVYDTARAAVWHVDLYRLERPEDAAELGLEDASAAIALIEWPERLGSLPPDRLDIGLAFGDGAEARVARLVGHGRWAHRLAAVVANA